MKKIFTICILFLCTTVTATKTYLFKENNNDVTFVTNNDNYNYEEYLLEQNQQLIVPPEDGILSNDIIKNTNYRIRIFENSKNSSLNDIEINETTGSFTYSPNANVKGDVSFKYYIEYDNKKTNVSYIFFYVKNTISEYTVNYYKKNTKVKVAPSIIKEAKVNKYITERAKIIENYKLITKDLISKKITNKKEKNNFDFYYEEIPYTGI